MNLAQYKALLKSRIEHGIKRPLYIEGPPGGGKTQAQAQVAAELGIGFVLIPGPTMAVEDLAMPVVDIKRGTVHFALDDKLPVEGSDCPDEGILCIDELPQSPTDIQKGCAHLMQEREYKGQRLKEGWFITATGNRQTDRAGASRILSHLSNRMTRIKVDPDLDTWCNWYIEQDECKVELLSFLRFRPNLLLDFDPNRDINPTPRAWVEGVGRSIGTIPGDAELEAFSGDVGEGAAAEFLSFLRIYRQLPNPDAVLLNPDKHAVPEDSATLYALSGALAQRATRDNFDRVMTYAKRMPPEFSVIIVRDAMSRCPAICETRAFIQWSQKEGAALLA